jgi:hypothetical protein
MSKLAKERPILFSAPMVRAILEGRKTQTRRIIKAAGYTTSTLATFRMMPEGDALLERWPEQERMMNNFGRSERFKCPHGISGEHLWVRETFMWADGADCREHFIGTSMEVTLRAQNKRWWYRATDAEKGSGFKWRPSIFMPRHASRITLDITEVRVQRLQDISEEDAKAEGVEALDAERCEQDFAICPQCGGTRLYTAFSGNGGALPDTDCERCDAHVKRYQHLWESINGNGSWDANPWVWAITFPKFEAGA